MSKEFMRRYTLERELKDITFKDLEQPYESTFDFQMKMAFETMVESFAKKSDKEIIDFLYKKYMNTDVKDVFLLSETDFKQFLLEMMPKWREEKHYLKWEDLEFNHAPKTIDVKMSGNKYKLVVGYNVAGYNLAILRNDKNQYYFLEADKQFFNDLHLEKVEEMKGQEIKGRLDRIGKTTLEHFQDIKELEVADEQGSNVKDILPYKCEQVEKSLKAFEIIKEKNVNMFGFKRDIKQLGERFTYKYYQSNYGNYHSGFDIQKLTEEEFNLLKEVLK